MLVNMIVYLYLWCNNFRMTHICLNIVITSKFSSKQVEYELIRIGTIELLTGQVSSNLVMYSMIINQIHQTEDTVCIVYTLTPTVPCPNPLPPPTHTLIYIICPMYKHHFYSSILKNITCLSSIINITIIITTII